MNIDDAIAALEQLEHDVVVAQLAAQRALLAEALSIAHELSSGTWSSAALRAADHPYARRHGAPRLDPAIINKQTGTFDSYWRIMGSVLINDSPIAGFLQFGTSVMFARPIALEIIARLELVGQKVAERAVSSVIR